MNSISVLTTYLPAVSTDTEQEQKALALIFIWNRGLTPHDFQLGLGFDPETVENVLRQLKAKGLIERTFDLWRLRRVYALSKNGQQMLSVAQNLADAVQRTREDGKDE